MTYTGRKVVVHAISLIGQATLMKTIKAHPLTNTSRDSGHHHVSNGYGLIFDTRDAKEVSQEQGAEFTWVRAGNQAFSKSRAERHGASNGHIWPPAHVELVVGFPRYRRYPGIMRVLAVVLTSNGDGLGSPASTALRSAHLRVMPNRSTSPVYWRKNACCGD